MYFDAIMKAAEAGTGLISAGYGIYASERNHKFQKNVHEQNLQFQKDKLAYDKNLQQQIFSREDNAVQRRVADLKAAGINPVFAAGSSAGAGSVVPTVAPHGDGAGMNASTANRLHAGQMVMNMLKMRSEIDHTKADTRRLDAEAQWIRDRRAGEVEGIGLDNEAKRISNRIREMDEQLRRNDITMVEVRNEKERIQNYLERQRKENEWSESELDLVAKSILIAQRRFELNEAQREAFLARLTHRERGEKLSVQDLIYRTAQLTGGYYQDEVLHRPVRGDEYIIPRR